MSSRSGGLDLGFLIPAVLGHHLGVRPESGEIADRQRNREVDGCQDLSGKYVPSENGAYEQDGTSSHLDVRSISSTLGRQPQSTGKEVEAESSSDEDAEEDCVDAEGCDNKDYVQRGDACREIC